MFIYIYTYTYITLPIRFDGACSVIDARNPHQNQCRVGGRTPCQAEKKAEEEREAEAKRDLMA